MNTIKAVRLFNLSIILISILILNSCSSDDGVNYADGRILYEMNVWDYSDNHYFLDTIYKSSFVDYYNNINFSQQTSNLSVDDQSFEVWVQTDLTNPGVRKAGLHVDLPELPAGGYNDSLKYPIPVQGINTFGLVRKLSPDEYILHKYAGYVSLKINLPENWFAGVAYRRPNMGMQFGTISTDTNAFPEDTLVLKMIKVATLIPQYTLAWELKLRNIYLLPETNIQEDGFEFEVIYLNQSNLPGISTNLITILGLDKYTNGRSGGPDNRFDYLYGFTIDPEDGWIIFPTLKPFLTNLSDTISGVIIDSAYRYPEIYTQSKQIARTVPNADNYLFKGFIKD